MPEHQADGRRQERDREEGADAWADAKRAQRRRDAEERPPPPREPDPVPLVRAWEAEVPRAPEAVCVAVAATEDGDYVFVAAGPGAAERVCDASGAARERCFC